MKRALVAPAALVVLALFLTGCESVKINRLLSDPSHWQGKTVHVQGTVQNSMGFMGQGAYNVADDTGNIWVISRSGVPARGARVDVEGTVFQGVQFAGQSFGVAIREKRHRSKN